MSDIFISNKKINSVFELLGSKEDDISFSVGWALSQSGSFLKLFLVSILKPYVDTKKIDLNKTTIHLQKNEVNKGRTDIEIHQPGVFLLILEAKRGWTLPSETQLTKYSRRKNMLVDSDEVKKIIVVSECSNEYAGIWLSNKYINNIEILHFPWKEFHSIATKAQAIGDNAEKRLLGNLKVYLNKIMSMQKLDSNWVFVVSLGHDNPTNWKISWRDIVNQQKRYFHPVGNRWPKEPPNYIAFRYDGKLKSIHFIESYEITKNLSKHFTEAPQTMFDHEEHFIYRLGTSILPSKETPTGKGIPLSSRVYCMIDTLLSYPTITEALKESSRRYDIIND